MKKEFKIKKLKAIINDSNTSELVKKIAVRNLEQLEKGSGKSIKSIQELTFVLVDTGDEAMVRVAEDGEVVDIYTYKDTSDSDPFLKSWKPNKNPLFIHAPKKDLSKALDKINKDYTFLENEENEDVDSLVRKMYVKSTDNKKGKGLKALLKDEPKENNMKDTDELLKKLKDKKATRKTSKKKKSPKSFDLTDVVFLVNEDEEYDIFAFFPNDKEGKDTYGAYSSIGQHSPAHIDYAIDSRLATEEEFAPLLKELENQGYNLEIKKTKKVLPGYNESKRGLSDKKKEEPKRVENFRAFEVHYLGATNSTGSRVKIKDLRFRISKTIPYDYAFRDTIDIAKNFLTKKGINLSGQAEAENHYLLFSDNFEIQIK